MSLDKCSPGGGGNLECLRNLRVKVYLTSNITSYKTRYKGEGTSNDHHLN